MEEKCKDCKHYSLLYLTDNEEETEELRQKQIRKNLELFCKVAKEKAKEVKILVDYVKTVDPFDTSYCEWNDGFLREPKTKEEKKKSQVYCVVDPLEPTEIEEREGPGECGGFEKRS